MALVTILAIGISLVFGRIVAVVGLIGGYVTPALFGSDDPSAFILFGYLTVILAGIFVLVRMRDWWAISIPALHRSAGLDDGVVAALRAPKRSRSGWWCSRSSSR